ncbi:MAG: autotransporter outer membrane beta-barrel domain-containing protein [Candidatus Omnitrophica bacterium]|nr:autotransporter outer membrane beta-barrel domain-containing protein [Candidatus Omnitrophota bacterium]
MAITFKGYLRISVLIFLTTCCFPYILYAQNNVPDRDQMIEDQLQEAIDQARLEGAEQSQENFRRIHDRNVQEIKPLGSEKKFLDGIEIAVEPVSNDEESTQAEFLKKEENVNTAIVPVGVETNILEITPEPPNPQDPRSRLKKIELALQVAAYKYNTDAGFPNNYATFYSVGNEIDKKGKLYGLYASYTYRRPYKVSVHSWSDLSLALDRFSSLPSFIRAEADLSFGQTSYDSYVTGKRSGYNAWQGNIRLLGGYDFLSQGDSFMVTPYTGIGYRRASDKTGGWVDWFIQDYVEYENVYNYVYVPVGVETLKHVNTNLDLGFRVEGNFVFAGNADFNLSDIAGTYQGRVVSTGDIVQVTFKDSAVNFKTGYGFKTSFKIIQKFEAFNVFTEPFFEYWHLAKSRADVVEAVSLDGSTNYFSANDDGSPYKPLFESSNETYEFGLRLGVQF